MVCHWLVIPRCDQWTRFSETQDNKYASFHLRIAMKWWKWFHGEGGRDGSSTGGCTANLPGRERGNAWLGKAVHVPKAVHRSRHAYLERTWLTSDTSYTAALLCMAREVRIFVTSTNTWNIFKRDIKDVLWNTHSSAGGKIKINSSPRVSNMMY